MAGKCLSPVALKSQPAQMSSFSSLRRSTRQPTLVQQTGALLDPKKPSSSSLHRLLNVERDARSNGIYHHARVSKAKFLFLSSEAVC